jgi:hypothetical protein
MLAKLTSKNQLTLPKSVVMSIGKAEYYDIAVESGRIIRLSGFNKPMQLEPNLKPWI